MHKSADIIILGAGLSGLRLAYLLKESPLDVRILEARPRLGGRILSRVPGPTEMGATWFGLKHQELRMTLQDLDLSYFPQHQKGLGVFESEEGVKQHFNSEDFNEPSYRIKGGTKQLTYALSQGIPREKIHLNTNIQKINFEGNQVSLFDAKGNTFKAERLVSTLAPKLLVESIEFQPGLDPQLHETARNTHTWMGDSIKFALIYGQPFWRNKGLSGTFFSQKGVVTEMYDHSNFELNAFALKGFLRPECRSLEPLARQDLVLQQMEAVFGPEALNPEKYLEKVWADDPFTLWEDQWDLVPHQNNGHAHFQLPYYEGRLIISGTETSRQFGGYMEGALWAARHAYEQLQMIKA